MKTDKITKILLAIIAINLTVQTVNILTGLSTPAYADITAANYDEPMKVEIINNQPIDINIEEIKGTRYQNLRVDIENWNAGTMKTKEDKY